jgi:Fe-S cluster biogenesis protein NfuA
MGPIIAFERCTFGVLCVMIRERSQQPGAIGMTDQEVTDYSKEEKIRALIEQLSAYIEQYHGGSVELDRIEADTVYVRLGGACEDCPLSPATLQGWVAGTLRQFFPNICVEEAV